MSTSATTDEFEKQHWSAAAISGVVLFHLLAFSVLLTGWSAVAIIVCALSGALRALGITMGYHRYFAHRSYKTGRVMQFILALGGTLAAQGPLRWWVSHHRDHHKYSDEKRDLHSPVAHGFWHGHIGWLFTEQSLQMGSAQTADIEAWPELLWLDRRYWWIMLLQGVAYFALGVILNLLWPALGTGGWQMLAWGYFLSSVLLLHVTFAVNSICHRFGRRPYATSDGSRNNYLIGILAMGEGWHNNHHQFASSARHGLRWWQIDISYYLLRLLATLGLVWDLRLPKQS